MARQNKETLATLLHSTRRYRIGMDWIAEIVGPWFFGMDWLDVDGLIEKERTPHGVRLSANAGQLAVQIAALSGAVRQKHAMITAVGSTDGHYEAYEQIWDDSAGLWINKPSGAYDFDAANEGELIEVNLNESVPVGVVVSAYYLLGDDGDHHWFFNWHEWEAWAKPTADLGSGSYTVEILDGDASTGTGVTVTAEEVSGRAGIPIASDTVFRLFWDPLDADDIKFEYHGAPQGTIDVLAYTDQLAAHTDRFDRDSQGSNRGVRQQSLARLRLENPGGTSAELYSYSRRRDDDANGHGEAVDEEDRVLHGIIPLSSDTIPYKKCSDNTVVYRVEAGDEAVHDYHWAYDGSTYVTVYKDVASAGAATVTLPCRVYMDAGDPLSAPADCSGVDESAFDDPMDDSSFDTCRLSKEQAGTSSVTEGSDLVCEFSGNSVYSAAGFYSLAHLPDDFDYTVAVPDFTLQESGSDYSFLEFFVTIGGTTYGLIIGYAETTADGQASGTWSYDGSYHAYDTTIPSGAFSVRIVRTDTTLDVYRGATLVDSFTVATSAPTMILNRASGRTYGGTPATVSVTFGGISFTP